MPEEFKTVLLGKDDNKLEVKFKTKLTVAEKLDLVNYVVDNSYINHITPSEILREYNFKIAFVNAVAPKFELPTRKDEESGEEVVDSNAAYEKIKELDIIREYERNVDCNIYDDLYLAISEAMEFKNHKLITMYAQDSATEDTLNNINSIAEAGLEAMTKLNDILSNINEITTDKGLKKLLGSKKVKEFFDSIKSIVSTKTTSTKTDNVINLENEITWDGKRD